MPDTKKFAELTPLPAYDANKIVAVQDDPSGSGGWKGHVSTDTTFADNTNALLSTSTAIKTYVDNAISVEDLWDRVTGTPNYVIPHTPADDIGATGVRITKGWFTDIDTTNIRVSGPAFEFGPVRSDGDGDLSVGKINLAAPSTDVSNILGQINGGTGFTTSAYADGKILIGNSGSSLSLNTITGTANQITVTNGAGTITLSIPSDLILPSTTTGTTQAPGTNTTQIATCAFVTSAVLVESIWDRTGTEITPQNSGDSVNMIDGTIYFIDPSNTSGTKSLTISQTLTGFEAASENADAKFTGLSQGSQIQFMTYHGASNDITFTTEDWIFDNTVGTVGILQHKINLNTEGGSGLFFNQVIAKNSTSTETIYYEDRAVIVTNTDGSEDGRHDFYVMENGTSTKYLELNGSTATINALKPFANIDTATLTVTGLTEGSIAYIGSGGLVTENNAALNWDDLVRQLIIGGGFGGINTITGTAENSAILGGNNNSITGSNAKGAVIIGGSGNTISNAKLAIILAGTTNTASGDYSLVGGWQNVGSGELSVSIGGKQNLAAGDNSYAMGTQSKANHDGCFVISDLTAANLNSTAVNQFLTRYSGGHRLTGGGLTVDVLNVAGGIVQTDGNGLFSSSVTLPDGTLVTTQSPGDNTTNAASTAYVDAAVLVEDVWDRVTGTPNYVIPATAVDDIGATGARITKGWFTDLEITNYPSVAGTALSDQYLASTDDVTFNSLGIGGVPTAPSALLEVTSTTQGFLPPRMTTAERNAIASPASGLQVYDTTLNQWFGYNGTAWVILG